MYVEVDRAFAGDFDHAVDGIDELGALTARPEREVVRDDLLVYLSIVVPESAYEEDTVSAFIDSFSVK